MSWDYAKDKRTDDQVKEDYEFGKRNERLVLDAIRCEYEQINDGDKLGDISEYIPDFKVKTKDGWKYAEVKFTETELDFCDLKQNQTEKLIELGGLYIQGTPTRYAVIVPNKAVFVPNSYCNKPCYRHFPTWHRYTKTILFHKKNPC